MVVPVSIVPEGCALPLRGKNESSAATTTLRKAVELTGKLKFRMTAPFQSKRSIRRAHSDVTDVTVEVLSIGVLPFYLLITRLQFACHASWNSSCRKSSVTACEPISDQEETMPYFTNRNRNPQIYP